MYIIIGANGFLGSYLVKAVLERTNETVTAICRHTKDAFMQHERLQWMEGDVEKEQDQQRICEMMSHSNTLCKVAYLAALHNPDVVEQQPRRAWHINISCLSMFLEKTENMQCLFYPSTDTVYGEGDLEIRFSEDYAPAPVNIYGRQKAAAEAVVRGFGCNVVRYPFLIAPSLLRHKKHFYDKIVESMQTGKPMELFVDSLRSSLDFDTAAGLLVRLMEEYTPQMPKTLNLSGDEALSKYDVGLMIARKHSLDPSLLVPVSVKDAQGIFQTARAQAALLDNSLLKSVLGLDEIRIHI